MEEPISPTQKTEEVEIDTQETEKSAEIIDSDSSEDDFSDEDDELLPSSEKVNKPLEPVVQGKNPFQPLINMFSPKKLDKTVPKNPKKPDQPFHMRLRNRIKEALKPRFKFKRDKTPAIEAPPVSNSEPVRPPKRVSFNEDVEVRYF